MFVVYKTKKKIIIYRMMRTLTDILITLLTSDSDRDDSKNMFGLISS